MRSASDIQSLGAWNANYHFHFKNVQHKKVHVQLVQAKNKAAVISKELNFKSE